MAGIGSKPPPPVVQDSFENQIQILGVATVVFCCVAATACPGIALGAAAYALFLWLREPTFWRRLAAAAAPALLVLILRNAVVVGWAWADWFASGFPLVHLQGVDAGTAARSFAVEIFAGPAALELALLGYKVWSRSMGAQIRRDQRADTRRWRAVTGRRQLRALLPRPLRKVGDISPEHPPGCIRLGIDREREQAFDLQLPQDLATHVFLPGVTGWGKTISLTRLAGGALANGYGLIVADFKGTDLKEPAHRLAQRHGLPFYLVDPDDAASLGYNPCSGNAAAIANKLIGAFSFGPSAEIYQHIAMESVPLVAAGLHAAGYDVTLEALYGACDPKAMAELVAEIPDSVNDRLRQRLLYLSRITDEVTKNGLKGLQRRLGALLEGNFGPLFRASTMLDWDTALAQPSVVYIALSTLATSEDVELMGRVIAQDLKQVCARRLQMISRGENVTPFLLEIDEFAAAREAAQLSDLLLQARAALMPAVVSTQYIPEDFNLRKSVLGAGSLICHRVESEDADALASALGTHTRSELTNQLDFSGGFSQKGSIRQVDAFTVHPNDLRDFAPGYVAVRCAATHRTAIVKVMRDSA